MFVALCVTVAAAALAAAPLTQAAPGPQVDLFQVLNGGTISQTPDGCTITSVGLDVRQDVLSPGGVTNLSEFVQVSKVDFCTGQFHTQAFGALSNVSLRITPDGTHGSATGDGILQTVDGRFVSVVVDVTFVPTSVERFGQSPTDGSPAHVASAVGTFDGSVTVDDENYLIHGGNADRATIDSWLFIVH